MSSRYLFQSFYLFCSIYILENKYAKILKTNMQKY